MLAENHMIISLIKEQKHMIRKIKSQEIKSVMQNT